MCVLRHRDAGEIHTVELAHCTGVSSLLYLQAFPELNMIICGYHFKIAGLGSKGVCIFSRMGCVHSESLHELLYSIGSNPIVLEI